MVSRWSGAGRAELEQATSAVRPPFEVGGWEAAAVTAYCPHFGNLSGIAGWLTPSAEAWP